MLRINDVYGIRTDDNCCTLVRLRTITGENARGKAPKVENLGKVREEVVGYYGTLIQAIQAFFERATREEADASNASLDQLKEIWERNMSVIAALRV